MGSILGPSVTTYPVDEVYSVSPQRGALSKSCSNKKLVETSATLVVTGALLVVTRS